MKQGARNFPWSWLAAVTVVLALYGWLLGATGGLDINGTRQSDYYNLQVRGWLKGQLSLDAPVDPALLRAPNPYDPQQRPPGSALHDASLYRGKYYIYFGPTPAVLLMLPFAALTGRDLPIGWAVGLWTAAEFGALLVIFRFYKRRHYPEGGNLLAAAIILALGTCGFQLSLLPRHTMYELPIACGGACFWWGVAALLRCLESARLGWATLTGLALGLAVASRPVYLFVLPLLALPWWRRRELRPTLAAVAACGTVLSALLLYNVARFGNPLEFGQSYQLSGAIEGHARHFSFAYLPFNLWEYFGSRYQWGRYFPFLHFIPPAVLPYGFGGFEESYGILPNLPIYPLGLAGLLAVRRPFPSLLVLAGFAALVLTLVLGCFFGCDVRYEHDFAPAWLLLAGAGLLAGEAAWRSPATRLSWLAAALLGSAASVLVALLAGMIHYRQFAVNAPAAYAKAAYWFDSAATPLELLGGRAQTGPIRLQVLFPRESPTEAEPLLTTGWPDHRDGIWVDYSIPHSIRLRFHHGSVAPLAISAPIPLVLEQPHTVTISLGALFPPVSHPSFQKFSAAESGARLAEVLVAIDGRLAWRLAAECFESSPGLTDVGTDRVSGRRFSGRFLAAQRGPLQPEPFPLATRDLELRVKLRPEWRGHALPLVTSGRTGAGDTLFVELIAESAVRFGYDHWGRSPLLSPPIPWPANQLQQLEVTLPSAGPDRGDFPLIVRRGGRELWHAEVRRFPAEPYEVFPLQNLLAASSCETRLPEASWRPADNLLAAFTPGW